MSFDLSIFRKTKMVRDEKVSGVQHQTFSRGFKVSQIPSQVVLDALPDRIVIVDQDARILSANKSWLHFCRRTGILGSDNFCGMDYWKVVRAISKDKINPVIVEQLSREGLSVLAGEKDFFEYLYQYDDRHFIARVVSVMVGETRCAMVIHVDDTDRERLRGRQKLLNDIFRRLSQHSGRDTMLQDTVTMIRQYTGWDAVGLRLREGNDFPYAVTEGYAAGFLQKEQSLCLDAWGGNDDGRVSLKCMCGAVIRGVAGLELPFFSEKGSFWTNSMSNLIQSVPDLNLLWPVCTACRDEEYETVVMIPLRAGDDTVGLLQLNDRRPGLLTEDRLQFFEELGVAIAVELQEDQTERALRKSEQNLRHVISSIRDGLWDWDILNDRFSCSPQWFRMLGYEPDAFTVDWKKYETLVHSDDVPNVLEAVRTYFCGEDEFYSVEFRMRKADETYAWVWARGSVVEYTDENEPSRMIGVHVDMTEAHQAQTELEESRRSYRQLFDSMQSGFALHEIICDETGNPCDYRFLKVNGAFEQLTGLNSENLIGRTVKEVLPGTEERWIQIYGRVALTGVAEAFEEYAAEFGRYYSVTAYSPAKGQFATIFNDVTEQKNAEHEILRARDAAEESNRTKSQFLANMSHELRTPLNAIIGLSELLGDTPLNEEQVDYVKTINDSGGSLLNIISDLLDFSKIDLQQVNVHIRAVSVREVVRKSAALIKSVVLEKGLEFTTEVDNRVPEIIQADAERLQQVFVNLLNNAVKFTAQGFVRFRVAVVSSVSTCQVEFSVADSGAGMDEQTLTRIFKPFQQGDSSFTRQHGGSGLGLAISKNLVELMGGTLDVESSLGQGSVFRVFLPVERN